jgi:glycogen synthase
MNGTDQVQSLIAGAQFIMLRYETEFTPCTGITAVSKQERRHFHGGVTIAPWCPDIKRKTEKEDPLVNGKVQYTDWEFKLNGRMCKVLATIDEFTPIFFLELAGCFLGKENPYDVELTELIKDTLYFGMAIDQMLKSTETDDQFIWGADWETVPALYLARNRHHISLTLHNTFDQCLENEIGSFGDVFKVFGEKRAFTTQTKTALEIGIDIADVVTTVNRGFADGMRTEPLQQYVMAGHLQYLLNKVVGIDNAAFDPISEDMRKLKNKLLHDFPAGKDELFNLKSHALSELPSEIKKKANDKAIIVSMGRRVAQKQHDLLVESVRQILKEDKNFPLVVVFATVEGDAGSPARFELIKKLQRDFPANVVFTDGRLPYYLELMTAADYNCMPSLYEPHGGAYTGTVIPIARAIDGLAEQICALNPIGEAARINSKWHSKFEAPTGFLFREQHNNNISQLTSELKSLLEINPSPKNKLFVEMRDSLSEVLKEAVMLRLNKPDEYVKLVLAALKKQETSSWYANLGGMLALIEEARIRRKLP